MKNSDPLFRNWLAQFGGFESPIRAKLCFASPKEGFAGEMCIVSEFALYGPKTSGKKIPPKTVCAFWRDGAVEA